MSKKANGEGSIVKNIRNGKQIGWRASIQIGFYDNGKPKCKQFTGSTRAIVKQKLDDYKKQMLLGVLNDDKLTLDQWYYTWLFDFKIKELKPSTFFVYESVYRNYIKNTDIGRIKLLELRTTHLQRYYNRLLDEIEISNVNRINSKIKPCLAEAERQGYIQKNWCKFVTLPKNKKEQEINVFTKEEQNEFMAAIKGHDLELLYIVTLGTGLRIGEVLGLKWSDISFKDNTLTVNRIVQRITDIKGDGSRHMHIVESTPKTKHSVRTIPIPSNIVSKLKNHKKNQNELILLLGNDYHNNDYVFCDKLGNVLDPNRPNKTLARILKNNNIKNISFHGLRHTYATRLFEAGVPPKTVQALLGHTDIQTTMNIYTHVMEATKLEAIEKINDIF